MLVRIIEACFRGADYWPPGHVLDVPEAQAAVLIEEGIAVPASSTSDVETRGAQEA